MKPQTLFSLIAASLFTLPALAQESTKPTTTDTHNKQTEHTKTKADKHAEKSDKHADKDAKKDAAATKAEVGKMAPDFTATDSQGNTVHLAELTKQGKTVVLQWFNQGCPFVVKHYNGTHKTFNEMYAKYHDKNVVILGIDSGSPESGATIENVNKARTDWGIQYPIVMDTKGEIGHAYGAKNTPAMVVVGKDGKIAYMGAIDNDGGADKPGDVNYVCKALDEIAAGKTVSTATTKPYGCGVKYKEN